MENMPMPKTRKPNAQWDSNAVKNFNEICVEQVLANNRPQGYLNNKGYANLISQFNERMGRNYTRVQMKNRWDALKAILPHGRHYLVRLDWGETQRPVQLRLVMIGGKKKLW
jgi:hypothetical protein